MARRTRSDSPGSWHHVTNRAIARRPFFENRTDIRYFLAGVARAVRRGEIEVHAWCVLTTHFHMLVRSPRGELANAMRRIQNKYVRYFNRTRRRDGSLVRGRFCSKPVASLRYRQVLVSYIDSNPVRAGLCTDACHYPWGSAQQYVARTGPRWLCRDWVESWIAAGSASGRYDPNDYPRSRDARAQERVAALVTSRLAASEESDDLDSLLAMASPETLAWLQRKATLGDGATVGQPCVAAEAVTDAIARFAAEHGKWGIGTDTRPINGWHVLRAGLLRDLAGARFQAVALRLGVSPSHARRLSERHRHLTVAHEHYGAVAVRAVRAILDTAFASSPPVPRARVGEPGE